MTVQVRTMAVMAVLALATPTIDAVSVNGKIEHHPGLFEAFLKYRAELAAHDKDPDGTRQGPVNPDPMMRKYTMYGSTAHQMPPNYCGKDMPYRALKFRPVFNFLIDPKYSNHLETNVITKMKNIILEVLAEYEELFQVPFQHPQTILDWKMSKVSRLCGFKNYIDDTPYNADGEDGSNMVIIFNYRANDQTAPSSDRFSDSVCGNRAVHAGTLLCGYYAAIFHKRDCDPFNERESVLRPVAARITLCEKSRKEDDTTFKLILRHEILHALGFAQITCVFDVDGGLFTPLDMPFKTLKAASVVGKTIDYAVRDRQFAGFKGAKTLKAARDHFNCSSINAVPFEDDDTEENPIRDTTGDAFHQRHQFCQKFTAHWERYYMGAELMTQGGNLQTTPFSEITAAYFEDAMMYRMSRTPAFRKEAQSFWYGKDYGCAFIKQGCAQWVEHVRKSVTTFTELLQCSFPVLPSVLYLLYPGRAFREGAVDKQPDTTLEYITSSSPSKGIFKHQSKIHLRNFCFDDSTEASACFALEADVRYEIVVFAALNNSAPSDTEYVLLETFDPADRLYMSRGSLQAPEWCPLWETDIDRGRVNKHFGRRPKACPRVTGGDWPFVARNAGVDVQNAWEDGE